MIAEKILQLQRPIPANRLDFRVQSINKGGYATILTYKDARVDMDRLDEVVGPLAWRREHSRDNQNCTVSIYDDDLGEWIGKEDVGTPSNTEAEKGLASSSFKRACVNWGIGRELYDWPLIQIKLNDNEWKMQAPRNGGAARPVATWDFRLKEWVWYAEHDANNRPTFVAAKDNHGVVRFTWGQRKKQGE